MRAIEEGSREEREMNKERIKKTLLSIKVVRKPTKLAVLFISVVFIISMFTVLMSADALSNSGTLTNSLAQTAISQTPITSGLHTDGKYIEDSSGNIIYLRGFQKVEMADYSDGVWMGSLTWNATNVKTELEAMKSQGANTVRCIQAIENWKYDLSTPGGIPNREAVEQLLTIAQQEGMYVIFTPYRVTNYVDGGNQDPLPYPPYQTSAGASSVIGSTQDFVDYWSSVASVLKNYPNAIFEIWNEPHGDDAAMTQFFGVQQQVINAIRATGAQNIIMAQWDMGSWVNLDDPSSGSTMAWITQANLTDPLNNLVYVTHIYREYGDTGIYSDPASIAKWGTDHAYDYNELIKAFQDEKLDWVLNTLNKPLFVTEIGCDVAQSGPEASYETTAFANALKIFNEWGINYIIHWWRDIGIFSLNSGPPNFTPTAGGTIADYYLQHQPAVPTGTSTGSTSNSNSLVDGSPTSTTLPASTLAILSPMTITTIMMSAVLLALLIILPTLVTRLRSKGRSQ